MWRLGVERATHGSRVRHANHYTTKTPHFYPHYDSCVVHIELTKKEAYLNQKLVMVAWIRHVENLHLISLHADLIIVRFINISSQQSQSARKLLHLCVPRVVWYISSVVSGIHGFSLQKSPVNIFHAYIHQINGLMVSAVKKGGPRNQAYMALK